MPPLRFASHDTAGRSLTHLVPQFVAWHEPLAGTVCFPRLIQEQDAAGAAAYCEKLVESHSLMLLPASVYGYDQPCVRLGLGRRNLGECLARWEAALSKS